MSHTISVRLGDELHDNLTTIASVTGVRLSHLVRRMLHDQAGTALASPDFHAKLAERRAALARLTAYAPGPTPTMEDDVRDVPLPPSPENGVGLDLSALVE